MRMRKITALCLSLALVLLCGMPTAMADEGMSADTPELPQVTVTGVNVTNTEYFELGVKVKTRSFQSVGLVLAYDTRVLQAATWTDGSEVAITGNSWDNPTVLMTKGADQLSGKPALAYRPAEESDPYAYVYLGANALKYTDLDEKEDGEQVVTLRFQRLKNNDETLRTVTMGASEDHTNTVELAPVAIAQESIAGYQAIVSLNADTFYTQGPSEDPTTAWGVTFGEVTTGPGIGTTTTSAGGGDYAITFFDWDGRVIDAVAAAEDGSAAVNAIETMYADRLSNKKGYRFDHWLVVKENNDGKGLTTAGGTLTSNNTPLAASNPDIADFSQLSKYANTETGPYSLLVQASYYAVAGEVNSGNAGGVNTDFNHPDARYKLVNQTYYQYGSTDGVSLGQYAVRCEVQRVSALRADAPVIMALVYLSSGEYLTERVDLENTDNTEFELVVPRGVTSVAYQVLDVYGQTNWTLSVSRSEELRPVQSTILKEGAFALIVDEARTGALTASGSSVNVACFTDSGLTGVTAGNLSAKKTKLVTATATKNAGKPQSEWVTLTRAEAQAALNS